MYTHYYINMYNYTELEAMDDTQLKEVAQSNGIKKINLDDKENLVYEILDKQARDVAATSNAAGATGKGRKNKKDVNEDKADKNTSKKKENEHDDRRNPRFDSRYASVPGSLLPLTESLRQTVARTLPYWQCVIYPALARYDSILVVAHGNSLRGIVKHLKGISDSAIADLNLPTAAPYVFEFNERLDLVGDYFPGDSDAIAARMAEVAAEGTADGR